MEKYYIIQKKNPKSGMVYYQRQEKKSKRDIWRDSQRTCNIWNKSWNTAKRFKSLKDVKYFASNTNIGSRWVHIVSVDIEYQKDDIDFNKQILIETQLLQNNDYINLINSTHFLATPVKINIKLNDDVEMIYDKKNNKFLTTPGEIMVGVLTR